MILTQIPQQPNETIDDFSQRSRAVEDAFITTVSVTGANGEVVIGVGESFLESSNIPDNITQVFYSTVPRPNAAFPRFVLMNKAIILLDFSRPPAIDISTFPTHPTPNASHFEIFAESESWFTALNARLTQFFTDRKTKYGWLHKSGIYDVLLLALGVPCALWVTYRLGKILSFESLPTLLQAGAYVYGFLAILYVARLLFSYSRWVFPLVEVENLNASPLRHRTVWFGIMISIFGAMVWDAIKTSW